MADQDSERYPAPEARNAFAKTLHIWRTRGGWAHDTMDRWGAAAGFPRVRNSVFSKLERGLVIQPKPVTFIQLGFANDRLARKDYGVIPDQRLRKLVEGMEPITDEAGKPWTEVDFFGHFCGLIPPPPWALVQLQMSPADAEKLSLQQRDIFTQFAQESMLPPATAFDQLQTHCKGMSPEQIGVFRQVLAGWHTWTPEEISELTDGAGQNAAVQALLSWCDQDHLLAKFRDMRPD